MHKLVFFVPESHKEIVKEALFEIGAGTLGNYGSCSWECGGTGQFKPLSGSDPYLGKENQLETVSEFRVEMLVSDELIPLCIAAIEDNHPYETPAFEFHKVYLTGEEMEENSWV